MSKHFVRPAVALLLGLAAAGVMAGTQTLTVNLEGPGGHSSGDYGNVNCVHAASRSIIAIEKAVPDAVVSGLNGGNSVNSIASDARFTVTFSGEGAELKAKADKIKAAVAEGCIAENEFRAVKPGDMRDGVAVDIRWTVK